MDGVSFSVWRLFASDQKRAVAAVVFKSACRFLYGDKDEDGLVGFRVPNSTRTGFFLLEDKG